MTSFYGTRLAGDERAPDRADTAVVIVHGVMEHRGRYEDAAARLHERRVASFRPDLRGHGESPGRRTDVERFSVFGDDLAAILGGIGRAHPALRLFVWGHSLGSLVAADCVIRHRPAIAGVVTTGFPAHAFPGYVVWLAATAGPLLGRLPGVRIRAPFDPAMLSHDEGVVRAFSEDPLVVPSITTRLVFGMARTARRCLREARQVTLPWLAVHGEQDEIAPVSGSRALIDALGSADKQLVVLPGARHEVHNESPGMSDAFYAVLLRFIARVRAGTARDALGE